MTRITTPVATGLITRVTAFGLAACVTLAVLGGLDRTADRQYDAALLAQAGSSQPDQLVVVVAKRLPKA